MNILMTNNKTDIISLHDIQILVDDFYARVRQDELIGPIFEVIIQDNWPSHLQKMYRFWQTVLLDEHTYHGSPFLPHAQMPLTSVHFDRWIQIFYATVDAHFSGEKASKAKWQGQRMAEMFLAKIEYYSRHSNTPLS